MTDIHKESRESEFSYEDFVRTRMLYWMGEAKTPDTDFELPAPESLELTGESSNFFISAAGPGSVHGILEDSNETGWFYLYDSALKCILRVTHVYNRQRVKVEAEDVDVAWSTNKDSCCVALWGQIRAFLGLANDIEMRKPITDRDSDGFYESEWPQGFSYLLKKVDD